MLIAEELEPVRMEERAHRAGRPSTSGQYGEQFAGGRVAVPNHWLPMRPGRCGRPRMLVMAAAREVKVPESECLDRVGPRAPCEERAHTRLRRAGGESRRSPPDPKTLTLKNPRTTRSSAKPIPAPTPSPS